MNVQNIKETFTQDHFVAFFTGFINKYLSTFRLNLSHYQDYISRLTQKIKITKILQYLRFENKLNHNYNLSFQIKNTHNKNKILFQISICIRLGISFVILVRFGISKLNTNEKCN